MKKTAAPKSRSSHKSRPTRISKQRPIPASVLLRAEASRIEILSHAMSDAAQPMTESMVWAFNLAAAFLDSLGAPEKLGRYISAPDTASKQP